MPSRIHVVYGHINTRIVHEHVHKPQLDPGAASMVYDYCIGMMNLSHNEKQAGCKMMKGKKGSVHIIPKIMKAVVHMYVRSSLSLGFTELLAQQRSLGIKFTLNPIRPQDSTSVDDLSGYMALKFRSFLWVGWLSLHYSNLSICELES